MQKCCFRWITAMLCAAWCVAAPHAEDDGDALGVGEAAWIEHCAACHGRGGNGDGPFAALLRTPPPDITLLAQRNGGEFPTERALRSVDGRAMPGAHGAADMPIWGRLWREGGAREAAVQARLRDVIAYLQTLQK